VSQIEKESSELLQTPYEKGSANHIDPEFLLERISRILPGEAGAEAQVESVLSDEKFIELLTSKQLLKAARCALEHGLLQIGQRLLGRLNRYYPQEKDGWKEHKELLELLDDKKALISLHFQAKKVLPEEVFNEIFGHPSWNDSSSEFDKDIFIADRDSSSEFLEPFVEIRREEESIRAFMSLFRGRDDVFARQWVDKEKQQSGYSPVRRRLTAADIRDHLAGVKTYGIYLMNPDNSVWTGVIDIDLKKSFRRKGALKGLTGAVKREVRFILENIRSLASQAGIESIAEFSGGKGYHIWVPMKEPVPASFMRNALSVFSKNLSGKLEFFDLEIFPKQDKLTGKGLGNLVKLPLGIHRLTGKRSFLVMVGARDKAHQLAMLVGFEKNDSNKIMTLAQEAQKAELVVHPATAKLAERFPELYQLKQSCNIINEITTMCLSGKNIGERARKVLLGTIGHINQGRQILHFLLSKTPDYNRALLDYEISRLRGTPLGCRRIHGLMEKGEGGLDCSFELKKGEYPHPLLHLSGWPQKDEYFGKAEKIENLKDALENLRAAMEVVERFI